LGLSLIVAGDGAATFCSVSETATATASKEPVPHALGRYEIIARLARGGMGTVYLGRHSGEAGFQRLYAIKVMHAHLADEPQFVEMLLDEARLAARLHHPNVTPVVDLGSENGLHYIVMEYVEGASLAALLTKHRDARPPRMIIPLFLDALSGLHAAHTITDDDGRPMNLVHRDVSPHNVLVGVDGTARITDFGVAKAKSRIHSTRPGELKGKFGYMSPEHFRDATSLDCRSDIFSAGAMLWSALTGRRLFVGENDAETLSNILLAEIRPPSTVGHCPPAEFDAVVLKALERERDKRFSSAAEMEDALREAAIACKMHGSKSEVAAFVKTTFEKELVVLRDAVRKAASQANDRRSMPPSAMMPGSVPTLMSITATGSDPTPSSERQIPVARKEQASESEITVDMASLAPPALSSVPVKDAPQETKRRRPVLASLSVAAIFAIAATIIVVRSHQDTDARTRPAGITAQPAPSGDPEPAVSVAPTAREQAPDAPVASAPATPSSSSRPSPAPPTSKVAARSFAPPPPVTTAKPAPPPPPPATTRAAEPAPVPSPTGKPVRQIEKEDPYK
jgi:serine/threonine-protein kinase